MKLTKAQKERLRVTPDDQLKKVFPGFTRAFLRAEKNKLKDLKSAIDDDRQEFANRADSREVRKRYRKSLEVIDELETSLEIALQLKNHQTTYKIKPHPEVKSEAVAVVVASDWHYEELIRPAVVNGLNEFNLKIADQRIERFYQNSLRLFNICQRDVDINTIIFALLGDFISGNIHDENMETAQLPPSEAIFEVQKKLMSGIEFYLKNTKCNLVVPCAVGNHCVDENTEVLTFNGFKKAKLINEQDLVASFDKDTGEISFEPYEAITKFRDKGFYYVSSTFKSEMVSKKHNLVVNNELVPVDSRKTYNRLDFRYAGHYKSKVDLTDDELRLITWVVADGTLVDYSRYNKNSIKRRVQFKVSKPEKIEAIRELLSRMDIQYSFNKATKSAGNILQPYIFYIYGDDARKIFSYFDSSKKEFPTKFRLLSKEQLSIVLDTLANSDGCYRNNFIEWSSINKNNMDIIQFACITNGVPFRYVMSSRSGGFKSRSPLFIATIYHNGFDETANQKVRTRFVNREKNFVGIQTKHGTLITRRYGKVNFTGNSRITDKPRSSTEVGNSLEGLIYHNMAMYYENNPRVQFVVGQGYHTYVDVFNYKLRFHHGHSIRYGGGVGGLTIPLNKAINQWNKSIFANFDVMGHFHQQLDGGNFIVNGSLIGYSPYAIKIKAAFEEPKQSFFLIDKNRGKTIVAPILLDKS